MANEQPSTEGYGCKDRGLGPSIQKHGDVDRQAVGVSRGRFWVVNELLHLSSLDIETKTSQYALQDFEQNDLQEAISSLQKIVFGKGQMLVDQIHTSSESVWHADVESPMRRAQSEPNQENNNGAEESRNDARVSTQSMNSATAFRYTMDKDAPQREATRIFDQLDINGSGYVGYEELWTSLHQIGFEEKDIRKIMELADEFGDSDGLISRAEWLQMFESERPPREMQWLKERVECLNNIPPNAFKRPRLMLSQTSKWRIFWDCTVLLLIAYIVVSLPFQLAFLRDAGDTNERLVFIDWFIDMWFLTDLLLNFRTSFIADDCFEVWDVYRVARNYLKTWFLIDLISTIPVDRITATQAPTQSLKSLKIVKISRVLKILKLSSVFQKVSRSDFALQVEEIMATPSFQGKIKLVFVFVTMFLLCHMLSCLMALVGGSYLDGYLDSHTPAKRYLASMYWAITTVTTVGYGDILPTSDMERVVVMLGMVVGGSFYGYVIGTITEIITASGLKTRRFYERMEEVNVWCDHHRFPLLQRHRVRRYFQQLFSTQAAPDEAAIMNDLTPDLRNQLSKYMIDDVVRYCYIFEQAPTGVLGKIAQFIKHVAVESQETIVNCGEVGTAMFIIKSGSVRLLGQADDGKPDTAKIEVLEFGAAFGEEIVLGFSDVYHYEATAFVRTRMHMILKEEFVKTLWSLPDVLEAMREAAKHLLEMSQERAKRKHLRGRSTLLFGTSSLPVGFADAVFDKLESISAKVHRSRTREHNRSIHKRQTKPSEPAGQLPKAKLML